MLTFPIQEEIMKKLLNCSSNSNCADCGVLSPTWASLDFGVFLCSNCSGAHRSLGPTITRVKSAKLDLWHSDWVLNMQLGNQQLNKFWEANLPTTTRKPTSMSSPWEFRKFVVDKYIKKKFLDNTIAIDPLSAHKSTLNDSPISKAQIQHPLTKDIKEDEKTATNLSEFKEKTTFLIDLEEETNSCTNEIAKKQNEWKCAQSKENYIDLLGSTIFEMKSEIKAVVDQDEWSDWV